MRHGWMALGLLAAAALDATAQPSDPGAAPPVPAPAPPDAVAAPPPTPAVDVVELGEDLAELRHRAVELERRLEEVEKVAAGQRLEWSGDYRASVVSYRYHGEAPDGARNPDGSPVVQDLDNVEQWLHRLRFAIKAEPHPTLRVRARLAMFKRFGTNTATSFAQDSSESRIPRDTVMRIDRAWLDWFITPEVALSIGRISYADGSPAELREFSPKPDATWGQQMVDGEYDTIDLTVHPARAMLARLFYASWSFPRQDDLFSANLPLNDGTENLRIIGGNVDLYPLPDDDLTVQLGAYHVPQFRPFTIPLRMPGPNPSNAPPPLDGSLRFPSAKPASLGRYSNVSVLAVWRDIERSGVDLFAAGALGILDPNGEAISYPLGPNGEAVPVLTLASADSTDHLTSFVFVGGRLRLPFGGARAPRVGVEYNRGSRYMISFATPTANLTNKLAARGQAVEAYWIQPINKALFARLDWTFIDTAYVGGFFGPGHPAVAAMFGGTARPIDQQLHAVSLTLDTRF